MRITKTDFRLFSPNRFWTSRTLVGKIFYLPALLLALLGEIIWFPLLLTMWFLQVVDRKTKR